MGTTFETIYDRALITIQDYHLDKVAQEDYKAFTDYLQGILVFSVPYFDKCKQSLAYSITEDEASFNSTLTEKEINILAEFMVINWFNGKVQDVVQFESKIHNREFKTLSEAQNFKAKILHLDELREKCRQDITEYSLSKENFAKIFNITLN